MFLHSDLNKTKTDLRKQYLLARAERIEAVVAEQIILQQEEQIVIPIGEKIVLSDMEDEILALVTERLYGLVKLNRGTAWKDGENQLVLYVRRNQKVYDEMISFLKEVIVNREQLLLKPIPISLDVVRDTNLPGIHYSVLLWDVEKVLAELAGETRIVTLEHKPNGERCVWVEAKKMLFSKMVERVEYHKVKRTISVDEQARRDRIKWTKDGLYARLMDKHQDGKTPFPISILVDSTSIGCGGTLAFKPMVYLSDAIEQLKQEMDPERNTMSVKIMDTDDDTHICVVFDRQK